MASIFDYIEDYGNFSFAEEPFNEIDNIIFSSISYLNLDDIIIKPIMLEDAGKIFFDKYNNKDLNNNIFSIQAAIKVFKSIYQKKRYKDLKLYNYVHKFNKYIQYSSLFIDIDEEYTYVSFEGTDELISGWIEDAKLAYEFPVPAHKEAIHYINTNIKRFSKRKYILGGHSKGGNVALVAAMYAKFYVKRKIEKIYINDSPGLKLEQLNSLHYKSIKDKIIRIIPNYSIVGLMMYHDNEPLVVKSSKVGPISHNFTFWEVNGNTFLPDHLSTFSQNFEKKLSKWLECYNDQEKKEVVEELFETLSRANINSLLDIKASTLPSIISIIKESKKINKKSKEILIDLFKTIVEFVKEESSEFIHNKIPW